tara:strand:+ start:2240 stop:2566 length:327 start_codon:yes stop_codon:yes gene_type:complete
MSRIKLTASLIIFAILLSFTSIIKNKTRLIEKKIFKLNKEISYKKKDLNETQLDFFYLSSPLQLSNKIKKLGLTEYQALDFSRIYFSMNDFKSSKNKISTLNIKNEKK